MKKEKDRANWLQEDEIEIRYLDFTRRTIQKTKARLNSTKELADALSILVEKYNVSLKEIEDIIDNRRRKLGGDWFNYPLGD